MKENKEVKEHSFDDLILKSVEVRSAGVLYWGVLIGADERSIYVKGRLRWIILPIDRIDSVRLAGEKDSLDSKKIVDRKFYSEEYDVEG
jgi:hypothetical protein